MDIGTAIVASVSIICFFALVIVIVVKSMDGNKK